MILEMFHSDAWHPVPEMELCSLEQVEVSQDSGSLSFCYQLDNVAAPFLFNTGDTIGLRGRDSVTDDWKVLFFGSIFEDPERKHQTNSVLDSFIAHDAWNALERTAYQVEEFRSEAYNKSHVILFRDQAGERMTTGQQIKAVLDYAISTGIVISYIQADLDAMTAQAPADEQTDISCAEAIKKCLRWHLNVFTIFDYAESGSTLRFYSADQEANIRIPLTDVLNIGDFSIKKKTDMTLRGVVINYEIENQIIDGTTQSVQSDVAGESEGPNVLVHTVQIDGFHELSEDLTTSLSVQSIPADYKDNVAFVQTFFPDVCFIDKNWNPSMYAWPPSLSLHSYITSGYKDGYGIDSHPVGFWWRIAKSVKSGTLTPCACDYWPRDIKYSTVFLTLNLTASPAGTYTRLTGPTVIPGETIPTGVASTIFAAGSWPLYEGALVREIKDIGSIATPKNNINILNGLAEYETMRAPVQQVSRNYFDLFEHIKFGYPEQAGITDYIDMLRANRSVNRPLRRTWKA